MGPDRTRDPGICSQTRICSQARHRLRYAARHSAGCGQLVKMLITLELHCIFGSNVAFLSIFTLSSHLHAKWCQGFARLHFYIVTLSRNVSGLNRLALFGMCILAEVQKTLSVHMPQAPLLIQCPCYKSNACFFREIHP